MKCKQFDPIRNSLSYLELALPTFLFGILRKFSESGIDVTLKTNKQINNNQLVRIRLCEFQIRLWYHINAMNTSSVLKVVKLSILLSSSVFKILKTPSNYSYRKRLLFCQVFHEATKTIRIFLSYRYIASLYKQSIRLFLFY